MSRPSIWQRGTVRIDSGSPGSRRLGRAEEAPSPRILGAWFFVILAPTSSVVPIVGSPMAEHRMYLPLAAVVAGRGTRRGSKLGNGCSASGRVS
jgi:hypothetical protein